MEFFDRLIRALTEVHPLHPMLVHFPIGLTGAAAFFILLALIYKSRALEQAAFANIALAAVATLVAGLTGIYDNSLTYDGNAPNAAVKIILAFILLVLTTVTAIARWRNPNLFEKARAIYAAAYFVSFGIAVVLAFLGGVILYGF